MSKFKISVILVLFVICSCNSEENEQILNKQRVIIAGKIDSVQSKTVNIYYRSLALISKEATYTQTIDPISGEFYFEFDLFHGQDILFNYGNEKLMLFIEPSDSLFVRFNAKDFQNQFASVKFSGSNKLINEEILNYSNFTNTSYTRPDCKGKSVKVYLKDIEQQIEINYNELDEFVFEYKPSAKFTNWKKSQILYNHASDLIAYHVNIHANDSLWNTELFPFKNQEALRTSTFGDYVWNSIPHKYMYSDTITVKYYENENYLNAFKVAINNVLESEPRGAIRDLIIYRLLNWLSNTSFEDFKAIWLNKDQLLENEDLKLELDKMIVQKEVIKDYEVTFLNNLSKEEQGYLGEIYDELIEKSKNKVIYLDIWATWCGPCVAEIPFMIELHDQLKNEPNIEFIALCLKSDRVLWAKMIKENSIPGKHYFLNKGQSNLLSTKLEFGGYPTYMILKDGKIVNKNAPRPSSGAEIIDELRSLSSN